MIAYLIFQYFSFNRMLCIAINPQLSAVHRIKTGLYQYIFAALLSATVIVAVRTAGVLLVTQRPSIQQGCSAFFRQSDRILPRKCRFDPQQRFRGILLRQHNQYTAGIMDMELQHEPLLQYDSVPG